MCETSGVGVPAPQVGRSISLFIEDTEPFADDEKLTEVELLLNRNERPSKKYVSIPKYTKSLKRIGCSMRVV